MAGGDLTANDRHQSTLAARSGTPAGIPGQRQRGEDVVTKKQAEIEPQPPNSTAIAPPVSAGGKSAARKSVINPKGKRKRTRPPKQQTQPAVPACIHNDEQFSKEISKLVNQDIKNKLKIGGLIYHYQKEHENEYLREKASKPRRSGIMSHIAELAGISRQSAWNYYHFYKLSVEHGDCPNLDKLTPSGRYEIGRLMEEPAAEGLMPQIVQEVVERRMRVPDIAARVSSALRDARLWGGGHRGKRRDATKEQKAKAEPVITPAEEEEALRTVVEILQKATRNDTTLDCHTRFAEHRSTITNLCVGLLAYLEKLVTAGEGANLESAIRNMVSAGQRMLGTIEQELGRSPAKTEPPPPERKAKSKVERKGQPHAA